MVQELVANAVVKNYRQGDEVLAVLKGISYSFRQGQTYAVTGVSGSGKSTFLHILGALDEPTSGSVLLGKENISVLKNKNRLHSNTLGFVFQFHYLVKELTVLENVMMMGLIAGGANTSVRERALMLLEMVGLADKAAALPSHLSGGEQQRVSIARAIMNKPVFLIADEPTGSLDEGNAVQIVDLLLGAVCEWGMGLILCSHDKNVYEKMGHVLRLHHGLLE